MLPGATHITSLCVSSPWRGDGDGADLCCGEDFTGYRVQSAECRAAWEPRALGPLLPILRSGQTLSSLSSPCCRGPRKRSAPFSHLGAPACLHPPPPPGSARCFPLKSPPHQALRWGLAQSTAAVSGWKGSFFTQHEAVSPQPLWVTRCRAAPSHDVQWTWEVAVTRLCRPHPHRPRDAL